TSVARARASDAKRRRALISSLPEEAPGPGREAAVAAVGADDDERLPRAAARHANGVFGPLEPGADEGPLQDRLDDLSREDGGLCRRTVQLEATPTPGGLPRPPPAVVQGMCPP